MGVTRVPACTRGGSVLRTHPPSAPGCIPNPSSCPTGQFNLFHGKSFTINVFLTINFFLNLQMDLLATFFGKRRGRGLRGGSHRCRRWGAGGSWGVTEGLNMPPEDCPRKGGRQLRAPLQPWPQCPRLHNGGNHPHSPGACGKGGTAPPWPGDHKGCAERVCVSPSPRACLGLPA